MTYIPRVWADGECVMAADLNNIENGVDRAQGDVMVLRDVTVAIPASDPLLVGRFYIETDLLQRVWRDNGAGWDLVPTGGTVNYRRYLWAHPHPTAVPVVIGAAVGRIFFAPIDIPFDLTLDRLIYFTSTANAVGNVRLALYEEGGAGDTPQAGALVVESASVAVPGASSIVLVTVANTAITQGQYYLALQSNDVTADFYASRDNTLNFAYLHDLGAYGAYPDPCPAPSGGAYSRIISMGVRVVH